MKPKPLPLPPEQILVTTRLLADRWGIDTRTVIRLCRHHEVTEIQLLPGGRILYPRESIEHLESDLFGVN